MKRPPHRVGWRGPTLAGLCAGVTLIGLSWPLVQAPTQWVFGASHNDAHGILWGLQRVAEHVAQGQLPPRETTDIGFPDGVIVQVANLTEAIIATPITMTLGAVAAFNALTLMHHMLSAATGFWCARRLGAHSGGAALVASACALAPQLAATTFNQNPDVSAWYWIPLTIGLAWRAAHPRAVLGAAACVLGASLCSPYAGVMAAVAFACTIPWEARRSVAAAWAVALAGLGLGWALYGHPASLPGSATAKVARDSTLHGVTRPLDLLTPWPHIQTQDSGWSAAVVADFSYLGIAIVLLSIWGMWRRPNGRLALMALSALTLAIGPGWSLFAQVEALTALTKLHLSHRYTFLAVVALALVGARALGQRTSWLAAALVTAEFMAVTGPQMYRPAAPFDDGACALLADLPKGAVLDLPGERGEQWLWSAACHGRPTAASLNRAMSPGLEAQLRSTPESSQLSLLHRAGFRYIVDHGRSPRRELGDWPGLIRSAKKCTVASNRQEVRVMDLQACAPH